MKSFACLISAAALIAATGAAAEETSVTTPTTPNVAAPVTPVTPISVPAATTTPATPEPTASSNAAPSPFLGATLTSVSYEMPSMTKMTAGKAALGMLGAFMMMGDGDKIVKTYNIPDPTTPITARLTPLVAARYQTANFLTVSGQKSDSEREVAKAAGNAGLTVDVETRNWMVLYFPFDWNHYKLIYSARARLINAASGKLVNKSTCEYSTADDKPAPDSDGIVANNAQWLRDKLSAAADLCVATFSKELVGQ